MMRLPFAILCLVASLLALSACAGRGAAPVADATDKMTKAEMCARACNRQHDRCYDESDTRFEAYGEPRHVIGMGAACDHRLNDCLADCRTQ